jgi:hypothetical protein
MSWLPQAHLYVGLGRQSSQICTYHPAVHQMKRVLRLPSLKFNYPSQRQFRQQFTREYDYSTHPPSGFRSSQALIYLGMQFSRIDGQRRERLPSRNYKIARRERRIGSQRLKDVAPSHRRIAGIISGSIVAPSIDLMIPSSHSRSTLCFDDTAALRFATYICLM